MRNILLILLFVAPSFSFGQQAEMEAGKALSMDGIDFIYSLGIEEERNIDGKQYSVFPVEFSVINRGKFSKIFLIDKEKMVENPEFDLTKRAFLAKFYAINGLPMPATAKFAVVSAEPNMELIVYHKTLIGNRRKTLAAFNLQPGQTLSSHVAIAVLKGQKPSISMQPFISSIY